jgi:hypothetical protein
MIFNKLIIYYEYIMNELPTELQICVFDFLNIDFLPYNKNSLVVFRSNPIWKPKVFEKYGFVINDNYYMYYKWQKKLELKSLIYQRLWTYGCIGKIEPLVKPDWGPAVKVI